MKTSIKRFLLTLVIFMGFSSLSFSQISKSDVESMLVQEGITLDAIQKIYVYNVKSFYTDGTNKYVYEEYENLKYSLSNTGVLIQGKSVQLFPYASMKHLTIGKTSMTIHRFQ